MMLARKSGGEQDATVMEPVRVYQENLATVDKLHREGQDVLATGTGGVLAFGCRATGSIRSRRAEFLRRHASRDNPIIAREVGYSYAVRLLGLGGGISLYA